MKMPLDKIRAEADALAKELPNLLASAGPASSSHLGAAGRRRPGQGEDFWQYRPYGVEDSATRVDWRKSARGDQLYVRESEMETARTFLFWCDTASGFDWRSSDKLPTKAGRALVLIKALATSLTKSGDRCGALGGPRKPNIGSKAAVTTLEDLWKNTPSSVLPQANQKPATLILASDFYHPLDDLRTWIKQLAIANKTGVLLMVVDPIEANYPYEGRINFFKPDSKQFRLIGRAENTREEYLQRFKQRQEDIKKIAQSIGWSAIFHQTDLSPVPSFVEIAQWLKLPSKNEGKSA